MKIFSKNTRGGGCNPRSFTASLFGAPFMLVPKGMVSMMLSHKKTAPGNALD